MNKIPEKFKKYFWDTSLEKIDLQKHQNYIIERLAEYGDTKSYHWLKEEYTKKKIKAIVLKSRKVSPKTKNFWQII